MNEYLHSIIKSGPHSLPHHRNPVSTSVANTRALQLDNSQAQPTRHATRLFQYKARHFFAFFLAAGQERKSPPYASVAINKNLQVAKSKQHFQPSLTATRPLHLTLTTQITAAIKGRKANNRGKTDSLKLSENTCG